MKNKMKRKSSTLDRRSFLKKTTVAVAAVSSPYLIPRHVLANEDSPGANETITIGYIGCGRQQGAHRRLPSYTKVVGTADCNIARAKQWATGFGCDAYQDYRKLLERDDLDAVFIATPDHWHALHTIHACMAGKDVYCEKAITLTIAEGQLMINAVRKYKRIFQAGSQQRSDTRSVTGCEAVRDGAIGAIDKVLMRNLESPWICKLPGQPCPKEINWDMWLGQTEVRPYHQDIYLPRVNPGWLSFKPYSGGEMTGWGAHSFDMVQYSLGADLSGPIEAWIEGEYEELVFTEPKPRSWGYSVCSKPPVHMQYAGGAEVYFGTGGNSFGGIFTGEKGKIEVNRNRFTSNPPEIAAGLLEGKTLRTGIAPHHEDFLDSIKTREDPSAHIDVAVRATDCCHVGNIARWLGRKVVYDPKTRTFPGDAEANALCSREQRKPYEIPDVGRAV